MRVNPDHESFGRIGCTVSGGDWYIRVAGAGCDSDREEAEGFCQKGLTKPCCF